MSEELKQAAQRVIEAYDVLDKLDSFVKLAHEMKALRALTQHPAAQAGEVDTGPRVLREVFALCEDTMTKMESESTEFSRGRAFEAKGISRAIGTWFQDEFCGRSHMGEPVTQPAAQATPEPVAIGPLAKRNIYDAIRTAYDLGYNDARNARTVPGDSAPGYDGRSVEEDHGSALFNLLSKRLKPATPEPVGEVVYQLQSGDGKWIDQTRASYDYNVKHGNTVRVFYTRPAPGVPEDVKDLIKKAKKLGKGNDTAGYREALTDIGRAMLAAAQAKGGQT